MLMLIFIDWKNHQSYPKDQFQQRKEKFIENDFNEPLINLNSMTI